MSIKRQLIRQLKKGLIKVGLKEPIIPKLEVSEGHLGGYVIGKPAPGTWCPEIWDWSMDTLGVSSMLDIGCGLGYVMQYYAGRGKQVLGVDGSPSAIAQHLMSERVVQHDYTKGAWQPAETYDMIWSSEFLEHVEEQYLPHFMDTFKMAKHYIFVTFAVPGQQGHHHVNLQYADYWIAHFAEIGFTYEAELTAHARALLPEKGLQGMQFRDKGLVFKRT